MEIIVRPRGGGKTYELVKRSAQTGIPIVAPGSGLHIKLLARELGLTIPEPIAAIDAPNSISEKVYVDDAFIVLNEMIGPRVVAVTEHAPNDERWPYDTWDLGEEKHLAPEVISLKMLEMLAYSEVNIVTAERILDDVKAMLKRQVVANPHAINEVNQ